MLWKPGQAVSGSVQWKGIRIYAEAPDSVTVKPLTFRMEKAQTIPIIF